MTTSMIMTTRNILCYANLEVQKQRYAAKLYKFSATFDSFRQLFCIKKVHTLLFIYIYIFLVSRSLAKQKFFYLPCFSRSHNHSYCLIKIKPQCEAIYKFIKVPNSKNMETKYKQVSSKSLKTFCSQKHWVCWNLDFSIFLWKMKFWTKFISTQFNSRSAKKSFIVSLAVHRNFQ